MKLVVTQEDYGKRLDVFVTEQIDELNRSSVSKLCNQDKVLVNGVSVKAGYKLKTDETVTVDFDIEELKTIPKIELPIIYEDKDCIVIDKPAAILTHSKGVFNPEATVATFIADKVSGMDGDRAGIVHRLDRATSGVIICAKTPEALSALQKQFSQRNVKKTYYAVVEGSLDPAKAIIEMGIERNPRDPKTFRASEHGKPAVTKYETVTSTGAYSLVRLEPLTGRTHQLRVHLKQLGHPIVGDTIYGGMPAERLFLHAEQLEITTPDRKRNVFESKLPQAFHDILDT